MSIDMRAQSLAAWKQQSWVTWLGTIQQACYFFLHSETLKNPKFESISKIAVLPSKTKTLR